MERDRGIFASLTDRGIFPLVFTGLALCLSGAFALFLAFRSEFLPHDVYQIGFDASELSVISPNLVKFMLHDRAAFGGVLLAMGSLYMWLAYYPLASGQRWAWNTFVVSGVTGFGSFLLYIGYGYLDHWHGAATLALIPVYLIGILKSRKQTKGTWSIKPSRRIIRQSFRPVLSALCLLLYAAGLILGGLVICFIGITTVFVPQDLQFIELCSLDIQEISSSLVGVIAHDRAGFGGGLLTTGVTVWLILVNAPVTHSLRQVITLSGVFGFSAAIGIHFYVGYTDFFHLLPAYLGTAIFLIGIIPLWTSRSIKP